MSKLYVILFVFVLCSCAITNFSAKNNIRREHVQQYQHTMNVATAVSAVMAGVVGVVHYFTNEKDNDHQVEGKPELMKPDLD